MPARRPHGAVRAAAAALLVPVASAAAGASCAPAPPPPSPLSAAATPEERAAFWREDLDALVEGLPAKHKNAFFRTGRDEFEAAAADLRRRIPQMRDHEIAVGFMSLAAMLGDGHTRAGGDAAPVPFGFYPIDFYWFTDGLFVIRAPAGERDLLGCRLARIGETPAEEAVRRVSAVFPFENDSQLRQNVMRWLRSPEVLHATGVAAAPDRATFVLRGDAGAEREVPLAPSDPARDGDLASLDLPEGTLKKYLAKRRPESYWFEHDESAGLLYCRYDRCRDDPGRSVAAFADELLTYVDDHPVERLVVDLRRNGGGDSALSRPLIDGIARRPAVNRDGRLFVLIGRGTYSSAQLNANEFRRRTRAILVGEPTGQKPNAYGEVRHFRLPHSGMEIQYSTKYFRTDDADPPSMMPDIQVAPAYADYAAGRDVVMEAVLRLRAK